LTRQSKRARGGLSWLRRATAGPVIAATAIGGPLVAGAVVAGTVTLTGAGVAAAMPAHHAVTRSAVVVAEARRRHFGKILVTPRVGRALYILPRGSCNASCIAIWPRLVMPKGKTIPKGAPCLGTARFGTHHRLQVTYHGKRLYKFVGDSGHSVNGNNDMGFKVAKVVACM
jgi:predicted lipoprotein with Yx(FWY)xxD motif